MNLAGAPFHYADRHVAVGLVLVLALLAGVALLLAKKGGKP